MTTKTMDCSGFAIFDADGKVLLVRQTYGKKKWCLPGGEQYEGEPAWDTAIRECNEEINVEIAPDEFSLVGIYFLSHRNAYAYIFKVMNWSGNPVPDGTEIDEIRFFSLDELPSPMSNFTVQRIRDAAQFQGKVFLREQHVSNYIIGDTKNFD